MKKFIALLLTLAVVMSLVGCVTDANVTETDLSKPIVLKWVMPGPGEQKDSKMVWAKFNEELKKVKGFENFLKPLYQLGTTGPRASY